MPDAVPVERNRIGRNEQAFRAFRPKQLILYAQDLGGNGQRGAFVHVSAHEGTLFFVRCGKRGNHAALAQ